jgi:hypothetical protein
MRVSCEQKCSFSIGFINLGLGKQKNLNLTSHLLEITCAVNSALPKLFLCFLVCLFPSYTSSVSSNVSLLVLNLRFTFFCANFTSPFLHSFFLHFNHICYFLSSKVKLPLCLIQHHAIKTYGGIEV